MLGSTPGPNADLMMTLIVRQSFQNNLFGFGAAASVLLTLVMFVWVARLVAHLPPRPGGGDMTGHRAVPAHAQARERARCSTR